MQFRGLSVGCWLVTQVNCSQTAKRLLFIVLKVALLIDDRVIVLF